MGMGQPDNSLPPQLDRRGRPPNLGLKALPVVIQIGGPAAACLPRQSYDH